MPHPRGSPIFTKYLDRFFFLFLNKAAKILQMEDWGRDLGN